MAEHAGMGEFYKPAAPLSLATIRPCDRTAGNPEGTTSIAGGSGRGPRPGRWHDGHDRAGSKLAGHGRLHL